MVEIRKGSWSQFINEICNKDLYCFGSGFQAEWISEKVTGYLIADKIKAFIDNDIRKAGTKKVIDNIPIPIISFESFLKTNKNHSVVLITNMNFADIIEQMDEEDCLDGMICFADFLLETETTSESTFLVQFEEGIIPKTIHYCWFGETQIPKQYERYMESWRNFCPDYEIVRWDESNYDISKNEYLKQAYDCKKWAFVSDYARLDIIYQNGGIYLDTDVELIRNIDKLLQNKMYCGFEQGNMVSTGLGFGAVKGFEHVKKMRDLYHNVNFVDKQGRMNETTCPIYNTQYLEKVGMKRNGAHQIVDGITIYARETLAPETFSGWRTAFGENTYSIHHYDATWRGTEWREHMKERSEKIFNRIGVIYD